MTTPARVSDWQGQMRVALLLWLATLVLFLSGLGIEPLRDWDEGTYAQVAREMRAGGTLELVFPTLWGDPFFLKPPLGPALIALGFMAFNESSIAARLPLAVLSSALVPLLYLVARTAGMGRQAALMGAAICLTLLPVMRHGRLAMLDGPSVALALAALLFLLRAATGGAGWALGAGLALSAMALIKGLLAVPFLVLGLALLLALRAPALASGRFWGAFALGLVPVLSWQVAQLWHHGAAYARIALFDQSVARITESVEGNAGPVWYYALEILKFGWPWLVFLPAGLAVTWRMRAQGWSVLVLLWAGGFLLLVTLMPTKLPWYHYPAWPALALICGVGLESALQRRHAPERMILPVLAVAGGAAAWYFSPLGPDSVPALLVAGIVLALGAPLTFWQWQRNPRLGGGLLLGLIYGVLLLFSLSGRSVWELNEDYPVVPVAAAIRHHVPADLPLFTTHPHHRPSLDFYAVRPVLPRPGTLLHSALYEDAPTYWVVHARDLAEIDETAVTLLSAIGVMLLIRAGGEGTQDAGQ
jgi:4-amino-4-deoxy-L-arabinose transferase-like glycosyltransferase